MLTYVYRSRLKNQMWYGVLGFKETFASTCRRLDRKIKLEADGQVGLFGLVWGYLQWVCFVFVLKSWTVSSQILLHAYTHLKLACIHRL
jgi:hypothetical protein